jgi:hypothetical protein
VTAYLVGYAARRERRHERFRDSYLATTRSRLEGQAPVGRVLIRQRTYALLPDATERSRSAASA